MDLLIVSFGIFAFMPLGWLFMAFVILFECLIITRMLLPKWIDKKVFICTTLSNVISGIIGMIISLKLNGGWYLVVWFPWVSDNEVDLSQEGQLKPMIIYYLAAFFLTLLIEMSTNSPFLGRNYSVRKILVATLVANILSYAVGSLVLYSYSFN